MHSPIDKTVSIEHASKIFLSAKHPKSFISLDDADHLLNNRENAKYAAGIIAAWTNKYLDSNNKESIVENKKEETCNC